jgi:RimJ/RimL family protein N-acetyltransferase
MAPVGGINPALARYIRLPETPRTAEFSIVVGDDHQRMGLARGLMSRLATAARANGIRRFRATALTGNAAIVALMERFADGPVRRRHLGSVSELEIDLAGRDDDAQPDRAAMIAA